MTSVSRTASRPVILTFASYYLPGYKAGGPIQSIANLVEALGDELQFRIVTSDRDSGDVTSYPDMPTGCWHRMGNAEVMYLPATGLDLRRAAQLLRNTRHDVLYLNSFFAPRFTTMPLLARLLGMGGPRRPTLLAPRGEFSPGALRLKTGRKRAFLAASRAVGLHRDILWHASSENEAEDTRKVVGETVNVHVASNLPREIQHNLPHHHRETDTPLRIVYLSRISPKKNLLFALDVLSQVKVPLIFDIVGYIDAPDYWKECQNRIDSLPSHINVRTGGPIPAAEVPARFAGYDLFFLPTLGENFGHVIIEAMAAGTPVLISDRTSWQDLETAGCGWALPLDCQNAYVERIERLFAEPQQATIQRRAASIDYARRFSQSNANLDANRSLFLAALADQKS